ncbi:E3 ubiquitin-protein ligase RNF31 [Merluccius polli]|uniref:E3 ubiquitin-protein ligase RNF31 n=1 Tax=Merluccius polli TaxID=89951 RepID=A0AA47MRN8_MERPO|nr:E3 ubiquitin-protein ligase RNF31 [Merluccius polli]
MTAAAEELRELRQRVGSELTSVGSGPQVKAGVRSMARLPLPLTAKYRSIDAEALVRCNTTGDSRAQVMERMGGLAKALNILEKYGCNLTNPSKPRYWRSVKHNNPVFQSTVDGMQGGRGILNLYGYTTQNIDGLSFPDDVAQPDINNVAAVTVEVMCLCLEVNMLIKCLLPPMGVTCVAPFPR